MRGYAEAGDVVIRRVMIQGKLVIREDIELLVPPHPVPPIGCRGPYLFAVFNA